MEHIKTLNTKNLQNTVDIQYNIKAIAFITVNQTHFSDVLSIFIHTLSAQAGISSGNHPAAYFHFHSKLLWHPM